MAMTTGGGGGGRKKQHEIPGGPNSSPVKAMTPQIDR